MQHSLSDRTAIVASIPMFSGLRKKDISQLARSADEFSYETNRWWSRARPATLAT